jgi:hypothetical protein
MYPLLRRAADVALRALASAPEQQPPFALVSWVAAQLSGDDPLAARVRESLVLELARETSSALGKSESDDLAETVWAASELLAPQQAALTGRRAWWTNWLSTTLNRTYAKAVVQLESERPLGMYFCATENHVIGPDRDMHVALEDDGLHLLALGTQFDLRRPSRIAAYHAPTPIGSGGDAIVQALRVSGSEAVHLPSLTAEDWQLVRPIPDQTLAALRWFGQRPRRDPSVPARDLVPANPHNHSVFRSQVRGGILRANPAGLRIEHLVLQLDLGQQRPLQLTIFGLREMWAGVLILRRWLGDSLAAEVAWSDTAWRFYRPRKAQPTE